MLVTGLRGLWATLKLTYYAALILAATAQDRRVIIGTLVLLIVFLVSASTLLA